MIVIKVIFFLCEDRSCLANHEKKDDCKCTNFEKYDNQSITFTPTDETIGDAL